LGKFPIAARHQIAELLDEVQATVIFDRNDHHKIRLFYYAINPIGAVSTTDRVLAYPHPSVLVNQLRARVSIFLRCHLTLLWELIATPVFRTGASG